MVTQQLIDYIKQQLEQNVTKEQIKTILINNKWEAADVEEGFSAVMPKATVAPQTITPPIIQTQPAAQPAMQQPISSPAMKAEPVASVMNPATTANTSSMSQPASNPISNMAGDIINPVMNPNLNHVSQPISNAINPVINPRMQSIQPSMQSTVGQPMSGAMNSAPAQKKHFFTKGFWIAFFLFCILVGVAVYVVAYVYSPAKIEQAMLPSANQQQTNNVVHTTTPANPTQTPPTQAPTPVATGAQNPTPIPTTTPPPANIPKVATPTTAVITVGSRDTTLGLPILVQNILSFTDSKGVVTAGADVIVSDNGISQEFIMKVGEKDTLKMYTITLVKVLGKSATFSVQSSTN